MTKEESKESKVLYHFTNAQGELVTRTATIERVADEGSQGLDLIVDIEEGDFDGVFYRATNVYPNPIESPRERTYSPISED